MGQSCILALFLRALLLCVTLIGCASKQPAESLPPRQTPDPEFRASVFLDPPPDLVKGPEGIELVYLKDGADISLYDKIMLDAVVFFLEDKAMSKAMDERDLKDLSDSFRQSVSSALGTSYPIVTEPGPGVLRVRTAITRIVPNKPGLSAAMAILPGGSLAYALLPAKLNNIGSASMEGEILDSITGERLGAAVAHKAGKKTQFVKGMQTWGHAKSAFDFWAKQFKSWLDSTRKPSGQALLRPPSSERAKKCRAGIQLTYKSSPAKTGDPESFCHPRESGDWPE